MVPFSTRSFASSSSSGNDTLDWSSYCLLNWMKRCVLILNDLFFILDQTQNYL